MHLRTSDGKHPHIWISDEPTFDIAMAAYNTGKFIRESIESVMSQTYSNWHIYIIDDCSKDNTVEDLKKIVKKWGIKEKCSLYKTDVNSGYGTTLKYGIESGQGELVAILDSDDSFSNDKALEMNLIRHKDRPDVSLIYSDYIESNMKMVIKSRQLKENESFLGNFDSKGGYLGNDINISHLKTFKRGYYDMTIGLDFRLLKAVDKDVILKLEEVGELLYIPEVLYRYRKHGASISTVFRDRPEGYKKKVEKLKNEMYKQARRRRNEGILTRIGETYCYSENGTLLGKNGMQDIA